MLADIADTVPATGTGSDAGAVMGVLFKSLGYVFTIATNAGGAGLS